MIGVDVEAPVTVNLIESDRVIASGMSIDLMTARQTVSDRQCTDTGGVEGARSGNSCKFDRQLIKGFPGDLAAKPIKDRMTAGVGRLVSLSGNFNSESRVLILLETYKTFEQSLQIVARAG